VLSYGPIEENEEVEKKHYYEVKQNGSNYIYLSSKNVKPLLGTWTYARQAAGILLKLK